MTPDNPGLRAQTLGERCDDLQMAPAEMLELANRAAELLVERIENLPSQGAWDGEFKQGLEKQLMRDPPEHGRPAREVLDTVADSILPYALRLDHPRCFGFVPSAPTWAGVVADFLAAGYNANTITWLVASGPSQLKLVVIDWIRGWMGYPRTAGGLLTSGGSAAALDGFVAARERAGHPERATVYMNDQSHSAQVRAARIIGIRPEHIRRVASDGSFRLDLAALARAVADDRAAGLNPIAVCANAGAGSTGAIDSLDETADYCEDEGIWLHVDAAYGGFAALTDPNFSDRGLQHSRSFRALKIWISVQTYGMSAFRRAVSLGMELASRAERYIRGSPLLEILNPASLGIVCFRVNTQDASLDEPSVDKINRNVLARLFWEDWAFISSTNLKGTFSLRMCIVNHTTTWDDVRETLDAIERFGAEALDARQA